MTTTLGLQVGEVGVKLTLDTGLADLSIYSAYKIRARLPNGLDRTFVAAVEGVPTDGQISYTFAAGELDTPGVWRFFAQVEDGAGVVLKAETLRLRVRAEFEIDPGDATQDLGLQVSESGIKLTLDTGLPDLSTYSTFKVRAREENGLEHVFVAAVEGVPADGTISYTFATADLARPGLWRFFAQVEGSSGAVLKGRAIEVRVRAEFEVGQDDSTLGVVSRPVPTVTPLSILGAACKLWLRADLGVTLATGVSLWEDQSAEGNDVGQATASKQPALVTGGLDGHPRVQFSKASLQELLRHTTFTGLAAGARPHVFAVCKFPNTTTESMWSLRDPTSIPVNFASSLDFNNYFGLGYIFNPFVLDNSGAPGLSAAIHDDGGAVEHLFESYVGTGPIASRGAEDGVVKTAGATRSGGLKYAPETLSIGSRVDSNVGPVTTQHTDAGLYELLIVSAEVTGVDLTAILDYLIGRYPSIGIVAR